MADYANITLARDGAVARLTLNRPDRRNALTHAMMLELEDAFGGDPRRPDCRALVLRGAGGHFCAGGDLDAMADMPPPPANGSIDPLVPAYRQFGDALLALNTLPQPTIADRRRLGGGRRLRHGLLLGRGDPARVAPASACPSPRSGFIPSQIIPFVVRRIGEGPARDLAVTGRVIDAAEAQRLGLGSHLCAGTADINRTLKAVLDDILRLEPQAVATVKRLVLSCATEDDARRARRCGGEPGRPAAPAAGG